MLRVVGGRQCRSCQQLGQARTAVLWVCVNFAGCQVACQAVCESHYAGTLAAALLRRGAPPLLCASPARSWCLRWCRWAPSS